LLLSASIARPNGSLAQPPGLNCLGPAALIRLLRLYPLSSATTEVSMQIYKVGGAVRDRLLGRPVSEVDWVVVGATTEQMQALGYRPVGADFPVFLHPKT